VPLEADDQRGIRDSFPNRKRYPSAATAATTIRSRMALFFISSTRGSLPEQTTAPAFSRRGRRFRH
jgi:hypothetical protein